MVARTPGIRLIDLLAQAEGVRSDDIYTLIAAERIVVDLRAAPLAEPEQVHVFRDAETAQAYVTLARTAPWSRECSLPPVLSEPGAPLWWDGRRWTLRTPGQTTTTLQADDGTLVDLAAGERASIAARGALTGDRAPVGLSADARELLAQASPDDFREANRRYAIIAPHLGLHPQTPAAVACPIPPRTRRCWVAKWRAAEQIHHCGYVGLLPHVQRSGNRHRKLPEETLRLLEAFIAQDYETLKQKHKVEVYGALVRACAQHGVTAPSYPTFVRAVRRRPRQEQVEKRQGSRAAYQEGAFFWELAMTTPRHGDRPFEIGHLDHTQLDIELVCSRTGRPLGRPWATFLTDAFSRRLLAVALLFDPPSYRSCMLVLRECVRRHQRLPQTVVVDGGAEFAGVLVHPRDERSSLTQPRECKQGHRRKGGIVGARARIIGPTHGDGGVIAIGETDDQIRVCTLAQTHDGDALTAQRMMGMDDRDGFRKSLGRWGSVLWGYPRCTTGQCKPW